MRVRPLNEQILVKRERTESVISGLIVPETAQRKHPTRGVVVAVGERVTDVAVGDRINFDRYAGHEVEIDGEPHLIMRTGKDGPVNGVWLIDSAK